eukprot:TRINITY_DN5074_c0_g1_i1.p1 TRINITY_DN5074_c0_g1~~TRINITY_DN5074_c0_g1_i1.p1  ORF type:complete len:142 (+),score=52.70 TRINITY_DN5074_c0_g1_i1:127-552(+)
MKVRNTPRNIKSDLTRQSSLVITVVFQNSRSSSIRTVVSKSSQRRLAAIRSPMKKQQQQPVKMASPKNTTQFLMSAHRQDSHPSSPLGKMITEMDLDQFGFFAPEAILGSPSFSAPTPSSPSLPTLDYIHAASHYMPARMF